MDALKDFLTAREVAERYRFETDGHPNPTLAAVAGRKGRIPPGRKINGKVLWLRSELEAWESALPRQELYLRGKSETSSQFRRRAGRPTKAEEVARRRLTLGAPGGDA